MKKAATAAEKRHMSAVAEHGCIVCRREFNQYTPACLHHPRFDAGMGQRAPHSDVIPLCFTHHQGKEGIHVIGRKTWEYRYGTERELLKQTQEMMK